MPNKRWIHPVGIIPDVPVPMPATRAPGVDPAKDKAVQLLAQTTGSLPALAPPRSFAFAAHW
jgi:C-terminal processing protease CtpA/Prc